MLAGGAQHSVLPGQHGAYLTAIGGAPGGAGGALGGSHSALTLGPNPMMGLGAAQVGCARVPVCLHACRWQSASALHHFQCLQSSEAVALRAFVSPQAHTCVFCARIAAL